MSKAEKNPESQESSLRRFNRRRLMTDLTAYGIKVRLNLVMVNPKIEHHSEILTIATELNISEAEMRPAEKRHLQRMASLEAKRQPPRPVTGRDGQFWAELQAQMEPEWSKAQLFSDDLSDLPKSWGPARADIELLSQNIRPELG